MADFRYVEVDGVRLRTSIRGAGRPLLLLSGIGANLSLSAPFEDALNPHGVQTIAVDAPGTGGSTRYRRPRRMPGLARTFELLLDALEYEQVDVLGASFGGILAQQLAHRHPAASGDWSSPPPEPASPGWAAYPARRARCSPWPPRVATGRLTTSAASPERCTVATLDVTPTRCCLARSRGSPSPRPRTAISTSSTRSASGPVCRGCGSSRNPPWCLLAMTTRSFP